METGGGGEATELGGYPDGFVKLAQSFGLLEGISSGKGQAFSRAEVAMLIYNLQNN